MIQHQKPMIGEIPIKEDSESGLYKINTLFIYDTSDNVLHFLIMVMVK